MEGTERYGDDPERKKVLPRIGPRAQTTPASFPGFTPPRLAQRRCVGHPPDTPRLRPGPPLGWQRALALEALPLRFPDLEMIMKSHSDIRIGTLASANKGGHYLKQIIPHGFESFSLTCWVCRR